MQRIASFIQNRPWVAVGIAAFIGAVLALSFGFVRKLAQPVANLVPGKS